MKGLELPEEEIMSSRLSQSLLQASLLSYKDNSASRSQYSHSHRSNSRDLRSVEGRVIDLIPYSSI